MDQIAIALMLIAIGMIALAGSWLGRHAGIKAIALLAVAALVGIGGGIWVLLP